MIILKVKKLKKLPNNLNKFIFILFLFSYSFVCSQGKKIKPKLNKIGFVYSSAKQNNILFFDRDYDYKTNVYKFQFFYALRKGENWDINLIIQPQYQKAEHQLLNEQFITPDEDNFEYLRLGLGAGYISLESERLAKGFTFIENLSLGIVHSIRKSEFFLGATVGHVSNFNLQKPNSGYNIFGFELGYRFFIK